MHRPHSSRPPKQPLYQVNVETKDGLLAVGPAMMREACDLFAGSIADQIKCGREKRWANPQVVPILNLEN